MRILNLVEVRDLTKVYASRSSLSPADTFTAVDSVTFAVPQGGSVGIVGESGSGKSTILRMIAGLTEPTSGSVLLGGESLPPSGTKKQRIYRARKVQMVFQDPFSSLDPRQTLYDALREVITIFGTPAGRTVRQQAHELFDRVGLTMEQARSLPRDLSGGQRQRFAIARALAPSPEMILLDEAVSALDVSVQAQILNLLLDLQEEVGISYLFVSHDLAVVRQLCDSIIVMQGGRIVEAGPREVVLESPAEEYTRRLLAAVPGPDWSIAD